MNPETKNCQNCKNDFVIESEDFLFYEKIKVPPPTFCPECRMVQILLWRNQRTLYKRQCSLTGESIISIYDEHAKFPVYKNDAWKSDVWDPLEYACSYDFSKPFFKQFEELFNIVPRIALTHIGTVVNSNYSNIVFDSKNVYLSSSVLNSEDVSYSNTVDNSKFIIDCDNLLKSEECYESLNSEQCFNCTYVFDSKTCIDSDYLYDCVNCSNCFLCTNQRNKSYMILNEQYSKEEYQRLKSEIILDSYSTRSDIFSKFLLLKNKALHKYNRNRACQNVTGDTTEDSQNCKNVYLTYDSENVSNSIRVVKSKDVNDVYGVGPNGSMLYQDLTCSLGTVDTQFSVNISGSRNILYSNYCSNSHDLFGCIGLKNASYCILNKQYNKETYFQLLPQIMKHMNDMPYVDQKSRVYKFGDFFPSEIGPFKYNETVALEYRLIDENKALEQGYGWKKRIKNEYDLTVFSKDLPDKEFPDDITNVAILCETNGLFCSGAYKISEHEIVFYKKHNLPLPRICPLCRILNRIKLQYPYELWIRNCMCDKKHANHEGKCEVSFETTYAPDRPEIVYCEKCYQQEVY